MKQKTYNDIYDAQLAADAIINDEFKGFPEDYMMLHCLLRKYAPVSLLEIGTNHGRGTKIIKNALGKLSCVYSLDLPDDLMDEYLRKHVGKACDLPFLQLRGDSLTFNYASIYPLDGWFIDGAHDYEHALHESREAIKSNARIIIWHDSDIPEVYNGIMEAFKNETNYDLYRITDTRIAYAVRK